MPQFYWGCWRIGNLLGEHTVRMAGPDVKEAEDEGADCPVPTGVATCGDTEAVAALLSSRAANQAQAADTRLIHWVVSLLAAERTSA